MPTRNWGYFKVPGCWPGITDYMQKDCQTVYPHPSWKARGMSSLSAAWYQREITIPSHWAGRRIALSAECLNSLATVFVDGRAAGEMRFPGGELDLTASCHPGGKHVISLLVVAAPLKAVMLSYTDTASARQVKGTVPRRGLCGDVYLLGSPGGARIDDVRVDTSVRLGRVSCTARLQGLAAGEHYSLRARITQNGRDGTEFTSKVFTASDLESGRITFPGSYKPERLWDLHTPGNMRVPESLIARRAGPCAGYVLRPTIRLPRVLDRRPRLLPERDSHLSVRRAAGQCPARCRAVHLRGCPGEPWNGSKGSASISSTPTITVANRGLI